MAHAPRPDQRKRLAHLRQALFDALVKKAAETPPRSRLENVERVYLWVLPWTGYLALLAVARPLAMPAVLTGWVLNLVWQIFAVGAHDARISAARRNIWHLAWIVAPLLLFASQSWESVGLAVANALIELTLVEVSTLIVMLVVVMVLQPGADKDMAWPGIVVMGVFILIFLYAFTGAWRMLNPEPGALRIAALLSAWLSQMWVDWRWLRPLAQGELSIDDPMSTEHGFGLILGQLSLWLLAPVLFWLCTRWMDG